MKKDHKLLHSIVSAICLSVVLCLILSGCASAKYKEMDDNIKYDPKPEFIDVVSMSVIIQSYYSESALKSTIRPSPVY